jgi:nucleoside-diphosphate-sugar epimerase
VSSGSVYESLSGPLDPSRVLRPRLPYSIAKVAAEYLAEAYATSRLTVLRFFGAYGPGEPDFKLIRRLVERFSSGARDFRVAGDGTNRIDPMHVDDAAAALVAACGARQLPHVLDLCQGDSQPIREFARMVYSVVHPDPLGDEVRLDFAGDAHERMLGWADPRAGEAALRTPRRSLKDGLRDYARWLSSKSDA